MFSRRSSHSACALSAFCSGKEDQICRCLRRSLSRRYRLTFRTCPGISLLSWTATAGGPKQRGLPRSAGHAAGAETFRTIATYCKELGVEYLTVYAFSTENWKRPEDEVQRHHGPAEAVPAGGHRTPWSGTRCGWSFSGTSSPLSPGAAGRCARADATRSPRTYDGFQANICLNYGGRDEILRAARRLCRRLCRGRADPGGADTRTNFSALPVLPRASRTRSSIIRPSGELRPIQLPAVAVAPMRSSTFTDVLWPDFSRSRAADRAIAGVSEPRPAVWR